MPKRFTSASDSRGGGSRLSELSTRSAKVSGENEAAQSERLSDEAPKKGWFSKLFGRKTKEEVPEQPSYRTEIKKDTAAAPVPDNFLSDSAREHLKSLQHSAAVKTEQAVERAIAIEPPSPVVEIPLAEVEIETPAPVVLQEAFAESTTVSVQPYMQETELTQLPDALQPSTIQPAQDVRPLEIEEEQGPQPISVLEFPDEFGRTEIYESAPPSDALAPSTIQPEHKPDLQVQQEENVPSLGLRPEPISVLEFPDELGRTEIYERAPASDALAPSASEQPAQIAAASTAPENRAVEQSMNIIRNSTLSLEYIVGEYHRDHENYAKLMQKLSKMREDLGVVIAGPFEDASKDERQVILDNAESVLNGDAAWKIINNGQIPADNKGTSSTVADVFIEIRSNFIVQMEALLNSPERKPVVELSQSLSKPEI